MPVFHSGNSTPKKQTPQRVRQTPSSMFAVQRIAARSEERNVSKAKDFSRPKRCTSPFHMSCSCPSIVEAVDRVPNAFMASLRNYDQPKKRERSVSSDRRTPRTPMSPTSTSECAVVVSVRMRPFNAKELEEPNVSSLIQMDSKSNSVYVTDANKVTRKDEFQFDNIFNGINDQEHIYNTLGKRVLEVALEGYNACLFAYGQTGSGKTYSIMGTNDSPGIIPRFGEDLFKRVSKNPNCDVEMSYFEIYNEKIHDLLSNEKKKKSLRVREDPSIGPFVENLLSRKVKCNEEFQSYISDGNKRRATAATEMNERSSRAHAICQINIIQKNVERIGNEDIDTILMSKVNIVDLAGSERASAVNATGERLKEGVSINKSLLTLGKVLTQLAERSTQPSRSAFVPYRESVLTWLLKESLGCNSRTFMLATISPVTSYIDETLSTLRYACQSRNIVNVVRVNEASSVLKIRQLMQEIKVLKEQQKEFDVWKKEKSKLGEKRELIKKYQVEVEELKHMLDVAKEKLEQKANEATSSS
ncbi:Kinesin-like KIF14, partial [Leptotrombidium deliense]